MHPLSLYYTGVKLEGFSFTLMSKQNTDTVYELTFCYFLCFKRFKFINKDYSSTNVSAIRLSFKT
jgi:hypothetical protein